jgi:exodeoxyribonuclease III
LRRAFGGGHPRILDLTSSGFASAQWFRYGLTSTDISWTDLQTHENAFTIAFPPSKEVNTYYMRLKAQSNKWGLLMDAKVAESLTIDNKSIQILQFQNRLSMGIRGSAKAQPAINMVLVSQGLLLPQPMLEVDLKLDPVYISTSPRFFIARGSEWTAAANKLSKLRIGPTSKVNNPRNITRNAASALPARSMSMLAKAPIKSLTDLLTVDAARSKPQILVTIFKTAQSLVQGKASNAELLFDAVSRHADHESLAVRRAALRSLIHVFEIIPAALPRIVNTVVRFLLTTTVDDTSTASRCRGVIAHLVEKEQTLTKLSLQTEVAAVLTSADQTAAHVESTLRHWLKIYAIPGLASVGPDALRTALESSRPQAPSLQEFLNREVWEDTTPLTEARETAYKARQEWNFASFNVNSFRRRWSDGTIHKFLRDNVPDVVFLTETKTDISHLDNVREAKASLFAMGYRFCYWTWCNGDSTLGHGYSGCAMLCKFRPTQLIFAAAGTIAHAEGRMITAKWESIGTFVGLYSPCSKPGAEATERRVTFDKELSVHIHEASSALNAGEILIVGGDINVAPTTQDVTLEMNLDESTHSSCKPHERESFQKLIKDFDLFDAYRAFHPIPSQSDYTWHRTNRHHGRNIGMRIDHYLVSHTALDVNHDTSICAQVTDCRIVREKYGSDHFPLLLSIKLPSSTAIDNQQSSISSECQDECTCAAVHSMHTDIDTFNAIVPLLVRTAMARDEYRVQDELHDRRHTSWYEPGRVKQSKSSVSSPTSKIDDLGETSADVSSDDELRGLQEPSDGDDNCAPQTSTKQAAARQTTATTDSEDEVSQNDIDRFRNSGKLVNSMPESTMTCGRNKIKGTVLHDSGAHSNLITAEFARKCGARLAKKSHRWAPTFILADGNKVRPKALCKVLLHLSDRKYIHLLAWIMDAGPCDLIVGSETMRENKCLVNYETLQVDYLLQEIHIPFGCVTSVKMEAAVSLYATETIRIKKGHHMLVPVNASKRAHVSQQTWGLVSNTDDDNGYIIPKGCMTLCAGQNWVQAANVEDFDIIIPRGRRIAFFHRQDRDAFDVLDCDLDACDSSLATEPAQYNAAAAATRLHEDLPLPPMESVEKAFKSKEHLVGITIGDKAAALAEWETLILKQKILQYHTLWDRDLVKQPKAHGVECNIELTAPFTGRARNRSVNPIARAQIAEEVRKQREAGIIQDSCSPYSSSVLLVPKPGGGVRFCVDFRALNKVIKRDAYPLPRVDDSLSALNGMGYFSSIDIVTAFWQVPLAKESRHLTAFQTPDTLQEYTRLPMGLATASGVFSKFIDEVFRGLKWKIVLTYIDDCLIYTSKAGGIQEHVDALDAVFSRLHAHGLTLGAKKCFFGTSEVKFLGHMVTPEGIRPDPSKIEAIAEMPMPKDKKELRSTLGMFGYYRRFCKDYSAVAQPLNDCLRDDARLPRAASGEIQWSEIQLAAFMKLKAALTQDAMLTHPEWEQPFTIDTDACAHGLGAVLSQKIDGVEKVVQYASRALSETERKYTIWELETLAVVWAADIFGWYLWNNKFTVRTDSNAVAWVLEKATKGRLLRWALMLQERDYTIVHRPGDKHGNADGLSRCHLRSCCPYGETHIEPIYGVAPPLPVSSAYTIAASMSYFSEDKEAWNAAELVKLQLADPTCSPIMARIRQNRQQVEDKRFTIRGDGTLCIQAGPTAEKENKLLFVVPESLRAFVLRRHHGIPFSGHIGIKKVLEKLRQRFWWKNLNRDVKRWIKACVVCQRRKPPRPTRQGVPKSVCISPRPWHTIAIDLVGPASQTLEGNKYILTMFDTFTRWVVAVPIPSKKAHVIAHAIYRHWLCKYGCPERIYSDRGTEFINKGLGSMCKRWSIAQIATTGWQPQANPVERVHRWLNNGMTTLQQTFGPEWDTYVDALIFAFNTSKHESTGFSPFSLLYGKEPTVPEDIMYGVTQADYADETSMHVHCSQWLEAAYKSVIKSQTVVADRNRLCREERSKSVIFAPDDHVMYWTPIQSEHHNRRSKRKRDQNKYSDSDDPIITMEDDLTSTTNKWKYRWTGPHKVLKMQRDNHCVFIDCSTDKEVKAHVNRLIRFHPWSDEIMSTSPEIDADKPWQIGNTAAVGSLIIVPLDDVDCPFGVGKVTGVRPNGKLDFQWYSNRANNVRGTYMSGWLNKDGENYYAETKRHRSHRPYTAAESGTSIDSAQLALHDFQLTPKLRIPTAVLRAIANSGSVNWDFK